MRKVVRVTGGGEERGVTWDGFKRGGVVFELSEG